MIAYTVHEPPNAASDRIERAEQLEFVKDGFQPLAAAIPPLWMVMNRLWLVLFIYLLVSTAASWLLASAGLDKSTIGLITLAANMVIGFEASSLHRWTLSRRNWVETGTVVGRNQAECERRFFDGWLREQPVLRREPAGYPAPMAKPATPAPTSGPDIEVASDSVAATPRPSYWRRLTRR